MKYILGLFLFASMLVNCGRKGEPPFNISLSESNLVFEHDADSAVVIEISDHGWYVNNYLIDDDPTKYLMACDNPEDWPQAEGFILDCNHIYSEDKEIFIFSELKSDWVSIKRRNYKLEVRVMPGSGAKQNKIKFGITGANNAFTYLCITQKAKP